MNLENLFNSAICCSCGLCCSASTLCEKCEQATLRANGLPLECQPEIHGLRHKSPNHGNQFQFSELYKKISELSHNNH